MQIERPWAFWRRMQYLTLFTVFTLLVFTGGYFSYVYEPPSCIDNQKNGNETGIDCGGGCTRICAADVLQPTSVWAQAFKVTDGQYNVVSYIENRNLTTGTPELSYIFTLYDNKGLIAERAGTTVLPPDSVYPVFEGRINTGGRIPTQTFIELQDVELWLPAQVGREQFTVVSRELRNTESKPRLDARITNNELVPAEDVEIVATVFDARGNALTSSRTIVPYFEGRATQDVIFTWPEPIAKTIRSCELSTDVIMAIDLSGSMNDDGDDPPEPISSVLLSAESFVDRLNTDDQASVVTYATDASLVEQLSNNTEAVKEVVRDLVIAPESEVGSTNTGDAIKLAYEELNSARRNGDARKVLVLLTDGLANAPGDEPEEYALEAAQTLKESGTEIFAIGLGDNVNEEFLQSIASGEDHYFRAASVATVDQIYWSITDAICEDGAAVIEIIPKTGTSFEAL